ERTRGREAARLLRVSLSRRGIRDDVAASRDIAGSCQVTFADEAAGGSGGSKGPAVRARKTTSSHFGQRSSWLLVAYGCLASAVAGACAGGDGQRSDPGGAGGQASSTSATGGLDTVGPGSGGAVCDPGDSSVDDDLDGFSEEDGD